MARDKKEKIVIELDFDASDFQKEAQKLNGEIAKLNDEQKKLKKSGEEGSAQYQQNAEALRENRKALADNNKAIQNVNTANKAAAGSNDQLKAQLSLLTREYNKLSKEERESSARGKELKAQTAQVTEELKGNEEAVGNNRRSVGDYGKALSGTPFGSFIGGIKGMGAAFMANPIGLIITAIVLALAALKKAFTSTEEGENRIAKATAVVSTVFQRLFDLLEPLASLIADGIGLAFEHLSKVLQQAAKDAEAFLEFLNFDDAAASLDNYVASSLKAAEAAALIADARAKTDKIDRQLVVENAKVQAQASDARQKALETENLSAEERNRLLNESAAAIDALAAKEEKSATLKLKALQLENSLTNSNKEALDAEADAEAELFRIQQKRSDAQKSLARDQLRVENEIKKAAQAAAKAREKAISDSIKQQEMELKLFIKQQGFRKKSIEEQLAFEQQMSDKRTAILEKEYAAGLVTETEYQIALLDIQNTYLKAQTKATIENAQIELDEFNRLNQSKIEAGQFLNDELFMQEQTRLENQLQAQLEFEALRLEQGVISQEQYNAAINKVTEENEQAQKDLTSEKKAADDEAAAIDFQNQLEIDALNNENIFAAQQAELERRKQAEIDNAEKTGADTNLIDEKYAKMKKQLDKDQFNNKLELASQTFGNLATIVGKESKAGKAFAIAQTTIDTYKAAQSAFSAMSGIPIVGPVLGGIAAAAAVASGIANVRKITSTQEPKVEKAARGAGFFGGEAHSRGGTKGYFSDGTSLEVEKDEAFFVVNKRSSAFIDRLNSLNMMNGYGDDFFGRGGQKTFLQDGGIGLDAVSSPVQNEQASSDAIIDAVAAMPKPVVVVQDINQAQADNVEVVSRAEA
jgi:hypothetical protein